MPQANPLAWDQNTCHRACIGTVRCDDLSIAELNICQKTFVSLDEYALVQRFKLQQGHVQGEKAGHGASRWLPMLTRCAPTMRPSLEPHGTFTEGHRSGCDPWHPA